jgi:hypothetical protein
MRPALQVRFKWLNVNILKYSVKYSEIQREYTYTSMSYKSVCVKSIAAVNNSLAGTTAM